VRDGFGFSIQIPSQKPTQLNRSNTVWDISFYQALQYMNKQNIQFICIFLDVLRKFPSSTYFFECVSVNHLNVKIKNFEFVLISANIPQKNDPSRFLQYFSKNCSVVSFLTLHKDSKLIVPCHQYSEKNYSSLGPYIRQDLTQQYLDLFQKIGYEMLSLLKLKTNSIWLNTHRLGVNWLHIRLDSKPKYYHYQPYITNSFLIHTNI
jgi:hypothetical protein